MVRVQRAVLVLILLLWSAKAFAGTVAILQLSSRTADLTETLSRLHGELLSVGLEVKMIERPAALGLERADARAWLENTAAEEGLDAIVNIVGDVKPEAVDVWVFEKLPRRIEVSRVTLETNANNASEMLAIRAVEVLRSTFLENDMAAGKRHVTPRPKPVVTPTPSPIERDEPPRYSERFGIELGAAALTSPGGVGPAILPIASLDWKLRPWLVLQATFAGFGSRPTVATTAGHARIAQRYGVLGGCFRFPSDNRLQPFVALSAGLLHTLVEGHADAGRRGLTADQSSFLLDGSLGVALRFPDRYFLTLAAHLQMAEPYVAVHIMDTVVGTTGRPNLVVTLTVGAWL